MARRRSDNYIPSEADIIAEKERIRDYMATHTAPTYEITYEILKSGMEGVRKDKYIACCESEAKEIVTRECGNFGWPVKIINVVKVQ